MGAIPIHDLDLPENACPQAGCLLEGFDAAGIALECGGGIVDETTAADSAWDAPR